ncbi:MAG: Hsp20/alpha crystallin family protein [Bacteroidota bacterium]
MSSVIRFSPWTRKPVRKNIFDDFFNFNFDDFGSDFFNNVPSVNVIENGDYHVIELAAPGLEKDDFKINVEKDVLTISVAKENKEENTTEKYTRKEFSYNSFKRSFHLPETVDTSSIEAKYESGVLKITLPKKEEAKEVPPRTIEIS